MTDGAGPAAGAGPPDPGFVAPSAPGGSAPGAPWLRGRGLWLGLAALALAGLAGLWLLGQRPSPAGEGSQPANAALSQVGGAVSAVAVAGDRAWLGTGRRLQGADVSDAARPVLLGQSGALPEAIRALATTDQHVLAAVGTSGLMVLDVADPSRPEVVAELPTSWSVNDVTVAGGLAYLAEGAQGLRVVDVKVPETPRELGALDTPGETLGVDVDPTRHLAFVADWGTGVRVIDVSDPAIPREVGRVDTPGEASDVAVHGSTLCVADRRGGLRVVDVSNPTAPRERGHLDLAGSGERAAATPGRCYVAALDGGVAVVDVSNPDAPAALTGLEGVTVATDVVAAGDRVYAADVGAQVRPAQDSRVDLWSRMHMWGVEARSQSASGVAGLHVARHTAAGLEPTGLLVSPSLIEGVAALESAGVMYLADGDAGVIALDVSDPRRPQPLATVNTGGMAHDVRIEGDTLLVANGPSGLAVVDIRDPRQPRYVKTLPLPGESLGLATLAGNAYVAAGEAGLRVVDLAEGREIAAVDTPGFSWDVAISGTGDAARAYVSDRRGGVRVIGLARPDLPVELGAALEGQGDVVDIWPEGDILWVSAGPAGVFTLDAAEPSAPAVLGQLVLEDRSIGLVKDGPRAYVAAGTAGLRWVDASDPVRLKELGSWVMSGSAERLTQYKGLIYVAAEMGGLQIVDPLLQP